MTVTNRTVGNGISGTTTGPVIDDPAIHAEVSAAFARYEAALLAGDHAVLNELFWASPATVRFGIADHQWGIDELRAWRATQEPLTGRNIHNTRITTFGTDTAVVTTLFRLPRPDRRRPAEPNLGTDARRLAHRQRTRLGDQLGDHRTAAVNHRRIRAG